MTGAISYSAANAFPGPPPLNPRADQPEIVRWAQRVNVWARGAMTGKMNNVGELTLDASTASTVFEDPRVNIRSFLAFMPLTTNAANDYASQLFYVSSTRNGQFTLAHQSDANADKRFRYIILG